MYTNLAKLNLRWGPIGVRCTEPFVVAAILFHAERIGDVLLWCHWRYRQAAAVGRPCSLRPSLETTILSRFRTVSPECSRKLLRADVLRCEFYTAACAG